MKLRPGLLIAIAFTSLFALSSCTRDYICQCEIAYSGKPNLPDTVINEYEITDTKKNAQSLCEQNSSETEVDGIITVETCELY